jgi:hypothetical protein
MIPMMAHVQKSILLHGKKFMNCFFEMILVILGHRIQQQLNVKCYVHQAKML